MHKGLTRQGHAARAAFSRDRAKAQLSQRVPNPLKRQRHHPL